MTTPVIQRYFCHKLQDVIIQSFFFRNKALHVKRRGGTNFKQDDKFVIFKNLQLTFLVQVVM